MREEAVSRGNSLILDGPFTEMGKKEQIAGRGRN